MRESLLQRKKNSLRKLDTSCKPVTKTEKKEQIQNKMKKKDRKIKNKIVGRVGRGTKA